MKKGQILKREAGFWTLAMPDPVESEAITRGLTYTIDLRHLGQSLCRKPRSTKKTVFESDHRARSQDQNKITYNLEKRSIHWGVRLELGERG